VTGAAAVTRSELSAASEWLDGLSFKKPTLPTVDHPHPGYRAWIADDLVSDDDGGYYDGEGIYLDSRSYSVMGEDESDLAHQNGDTGTMVHELFHAVQYTYCLSRNGSNWGESASNWITEGTADAVMYSWLRRTMVKGSVKGTYRYFDDPLDRPRDEFQAYDTSRFWLWLEKRLGTDGSPDYMNDLMRVGELWEGTGLSGLDRFLADEGGLYDVYPDFIREFGARPIFFSSQGSRELELHYRDREVKRDIVERVRPVAADAIEAEIEVPSDKVAELEIAVRNDHEDLHLIVDKTRVDVPGPLSGMPASQRILRLQFRTAHWQKERNRYVATLSGRRKPYKFLVRVVNVAPDASASRSRSVTVRFTLRPVKPCRFTASLSGDSSRGYAWGKVAHFSTEGKTTITGAFTNPQALSDAMEMLGGVMGDEQREQAEKWKKQMASLPKETLGISLLEMDPGGPAERMIGAMASGFKLQASVMDRPIKPGFAGDLPLSHMVVFTGDWTESASQQVRFEWARGTPGEATLQIRRYTGDAIEGSIRGHLFGQGVYKTSTGKAPEIRVKAHFYARDFDPMSLELGCIAADD
jgi:hypothetical protein